MRSNHYAFVALGSLLIACSAPASAPDPDPKPEVARVSAPVEVSTPVAAAIWGTSCAACHGDLAQFAAQPERAADATLGVITAGTDAAPWHTFWFLGDANRRALTRALTGADASADVGAEDRWAIARLKASREAALARDPEVRRRTAHQTYLQSCAACHGEEGRGDGPAAAALRPSPRDWATLSAGEWRHSPSASGVFSALSLGIAGTSMASYASIPIEARWALAEHVLTMAPEALRSQDPYDELPELAYHMRAPADPPTPTQLSTPRTWARTTLAGLNGENIDGEAIYRQYCASCHGESGQGIPEVFPPLVGVPWTDDPKKHAAHIEVILKGLAGKIEVGGAEYDGVMQSFHTELDDLQVAALATWVNTSWGNAGGEVSVLEVERVRAKLGYPPFNAAASPPDQSDAAMILATATCAGCHGASGDAPELATYMGMTAERFAAALVAPGSSHPRLGAAMHPSAWGALVEQVTDVTCSDGCVRTQLDALLSR